MDTSYLSSQVSNIIGQLHGLFDEIGVPNHERESRESELFAALSETLHNQVRLVSSEKNDMTEEAQRIITTIKQMEASLDENKTRHEYEAEDEELKITYPLTRCLQALKEKHLQVSKLHKERFEQVKKLVQALESYSSHLESSFISIKLPPTSPNSSVPPTFDLSPTYVNALDDEFTRVYEEYTRRVATVKALAEQIIQLWAELGTPQAQTDNMIVKHYRDSPEQLGLHEDDIARLRSKRDKLGDEKKAREKRLRDLKSLVEGLWDRLGVEERERKHFLNNNRGCGVRQINDFEDELSRLNELKRQNLHLFVEDARYKLQDLWDGLYFSEEDMLEFTPAFSDVYSDALLEAHEQEIERLEALKEQRAPTLALIDKHRSLVKDRDELAASSQDASRLLGRGQKGEKRDPTRLLREEKMRKRITKELPKIAVELRKVLEQWEDEYGRPFLVHGERYLDELEASEARPAPGPRSKTPAGPPPTVKKNGTLSRSNSTIKPPARAPSRAGAKTPVAGGTVGRNRNPFASSVSAASGAKSPTKIPSRPPLSHLNGNNSPDRKSRIEPREPEANDTIRKMGPPRAPPPKMRDLFVPPPPAAVTPVSLHRSDSVMSSGSVRHVSPEDVYDDRYNPVRSSFQEERYQQYTRPSIQNVAMKSSMRINEQEPERFNYPNPYPAPPASRQISNTSSAATTNISGSENWETYDDVSEPEEDNSDAYYARLRAARAAAAGGKRFAPEDVYPAPGGSLGKKQKSAVSVHQTGQGQMTMDAEGNYHHDDRHRIISGSEANWTDEDAY
ncbi:microtubule associated protein [Phlyctema vagabunda]|uniref:Microtubule associated protein n=1 Tax=Phlyctema vagabunda TaxID=108571 RepID=A0ABR4P329_9HELO